jgi:hypothetical protein
LLPFPEWKCGANFLTKETFMKPLRTFTWLLGTYAVAGGAARQWMKVQAARLAERNYQKKELCRFEGEGGIVLD